MLPEGTIAASEIWKRFKTDRSQGQLRDRIERARSRVKGQRGGWRWALREVDVVAEPGDSIGLVGANGSGKSTLLKILTRVMYPTAGNVQVSGRVGALIEVKAGIHPELTGRENIFLYGSLLGLKRQEVIGRFDDIVGFAELDQAIDRPLKFYSSGMAMRLGFGVAAFLNPDVLLVDEVLSVGDAVFQQRCLDRMRYVLSQGTTLIFVSHDLAAVEATCARGLWLHNGDVMGLGTVGDVLRAYRSSIEAGADALPLAAGPIRLLSATATSADGGVVRTYEDLVIDLSVESDVTEKVRFYVGISEGTAAPILVVSRLIDLSDARCRLRCTVDHLPLPRGHYSVWVAVFSLKDCDNDELMPWHPTCHFDAFGPDSDRAPIAVVRPSPVQVRSRWDVSSQVPGPLSETGATGSLTVPTT